MDHPRQGRSKSVLVLDGVTYHRIDSTDVPPAHAEVPVTLDDNGTVLPVRCKILSATITHMEMKVKDVCGSNWSMCER
jgi:hypothetical protein